MNINKITHTYTTAAMLTATLLAGALTGCGSKDNASTSQAAPVTKTVYDAPTSPLEKAPQTQRATHKEPQFAPIPTTGGDLYVCYGLIEHIEEFQRRQVKGARSILVSPEDDARATASRIEFKKDPATARALLLKLYTMGPHSKKAISAIHAYCGDAQYDRSTKILMHHIKNRGFAEDFVPDWVGH